LDAEAEPIAEIVGVTSYDVRLRLTGLLPSILCWKPNLEEALAVRAALASRHHGVLVVDPRTVPESEQMVHLRRFSLAADRLVANDHGDSVAFADITALIRAATSTSVVRKVRSREPIAYGSAPGRPTPTEETELLRHETASTNLLYIVPNDGAPLLLVEHEARYLSLGSAMRATEHENFFTTIELLRAAAPSALYDERFASRAHDSRKLAVTRGSDRVEAREDEELHLLVHVLARWLTRGTGSPYRDRSEEC